MQKLFVLTIGCILIFLNSIAQKHNGIIKGTVTTSDGKSAEAVSVLIKGKNKGAITDDKGFFEFRRLSPGNYTLVISFTGFEEQEQSVEVNDQPVTVSFQLKTTGKELQQVIVSAGQNRFAKKESDYVARLPPVTATMTAGT